MFGSFPLTVDISRAIPLLIPIVAILGGFAIAIVAMVISGREEERTHKERMFYAERGLPIPPELMKAKTPVEKKRGDLRALRTVLVVIGVVMVSIGVGVIAMLTIQNGLRDGMNGVVPLLIGVGLLVAERMIKVLIIKNNGQ